MIELINYIKENLDKKEKHFEERTKYHIDLVNKAANILLNNKDKITEFDLSELIKNCKKHDNSKFFEPERTPYIELTWNKKNNIKINNPEIKNATIFHTKSNPHHPEYWVKNQDEVNINDKDRDKSDKIVNVENMDNVSIAEMCCDWQAMSWELKTNTAMEWFNKQRNVRWHFSPKQEKLIKKLLTILEKDV